LGLSEEDNINEQFFQEYMTGLTGLNSSYILNPYTQNQFLKNVNMNPMFQNRDEVEKMVYNPKSNEVGLRRLSQHLYNTQTPYKRLLHYFSDMLTWDYDIIPINATGEEMKSKKFQTDSDMVWNFFNRFNHKKEFRKILLGMMQEDGQYVYWRDGIDYDTLQLMSSDYSLIDADSELGYLYSFNMLYFQQLGVDISGFAPEFKKYYRNLINWQSNKSQYAPMDARVENKAGQWCYWQQLPPEKAWIFKFSEQFAGLVPPFLGIFIDVGEIDSYKQLQKTKTQLEVYKMIFATIPRNAAGTGKNGNTRDDFALSADSLGKFSKLINSNLPNGVKFNMIPSESITAVDFAATENKTDIIGSTMKNFYRASGADQALFNSEKPNASTMKASTRIDSAFMEDVYPQFERFCEYHINRMTKKYKFKIKFVGTIFDQEERKAEAITLAQNGIITTKLASSQGLNPKQLVQNMDLMKSFGFPDILTPIQTANTLSKENGRPTQKEVDTAGEVTRDAGSNLER